MVTNTKIPIQLLNETELAELLGLKLSTVRAWRHSHRGPRFIKVGFSVRYDSKDVTAWLTSRPSGGEMPQEAR